MQDRRIKSGKLELLIDGVHSYILVFADSLCCNSSFGFNKKIQNISKQILLSRVWLTLRTSSLSRRLAIMLRPKWLLVKIP